MSDTKISALTATTSIAGADLHTIIQGGVNKKITHTNVIAQQVTDLLSGTITNGDTTHAPTNDAVFDALALKAAKAGDTFTGAVIPSVVTLTDAATIAVNAALGNQFTVTLGGNRTLGNPTGAVNGQLLLFAIRQDGSGSRTLAYDTKYRFGTDITAITLTTTSNKTDYIGVRYHSGDDKFDIISVVKGY